MMTQKEINHYRRTLKTLRAELLRHLPSREGILVEQASDAIDQTQSAADRELTIDTLNMHMARLRAIDAALARLDEGAYGICLECEEPINPRRLNAVPWAGYCIACQQERDAHRPGRVGAAAMDVLAAA